MEVKAMLQLVVADYRIQGKRSLPAILNNLRHLEPHFEGQDVGEIKTACVTEYILRRKDEGAAPATINRELATLKFAFSLAELQPPRIRMLPEENVRQGFVEIDEYVKVRDTLEPLYRRPYVFAYYYGWRSGEVFSLQVRNFDVQEKVVYLEPAKSKTKRGRRVSLAGEALTCVQESYVFAKALDSAFLFCDKVGKMIPRMTFMPYFKAACRLAGHAERRFHDLRRTAVRNLIRAGVDRNTAKSITGHLTDSTFNRYDIVDEKDTRRASEALESYVRSLIGPGQKVYDAVVCQTTTPSLPAQTTFGAFRRFLAGFVRPTTKDDKTTEYRKDEKEL